MQFLSLALSLTTFASAGQQGNAPAPRTFTAEAWALKLEQGDAQAWGSAGDFARWFPRGLVLGDADGLDGDEHNAVVLRSAHEVVRALANKPGAVATTMLEDQPSSEGVVLGRLARQLLVARLNLANDAADVGAGLKNYTFRDPAPRSVRGLRVQQVVGVSNRTLAGQYGQSRGVDGHLRKMIDLDGDGSPDLSLTDLAQTLEGFNASFSRDHGQPPIVVPPGPASGSGGVREPGVPGEGPAISGGTPPIVPTGGGATRDGRDHPSDDAPASWREPVAENGPRDTKAYTEWERERRKATEEYERELRTAEGEAARENKRGKYERKAAELRAKYEEKLAKADRKYTEKTGELPPREGRRGNGEDQLYDRDIDRMHALLERTRAERDRALEEVERLREENRRLLEALGRGRGPKGVRGLGKGRDDD